MNPFLQANWTPKPLFKLDNQQRPGGTPAPTSTQPQKKKKNFLVDQISTVTGMVGGIGGGILGAAAGGVGAIPGAAVGGAGGSALGEAIENAITGDSLGKNVLKEGLLGGVFSAGPVRGAVAAKGALAASRAAAKEGTKIGAKAALRQGSEKAAEFSLRGAAGNVLGNKAKGLATKQFGLQSKFLGDFTGKWKEDAGETIVRHGITSADDATEVIAKQSNMFDELVKTAKPVKKTTLQQNLDYAADDLLKEFPTDMQQEGRQMIDEARQLMDRFSDTIQPDDINLARRQYDKLVNYKQQMANPARYSVNKRIADVLRETLQGTAGKELKAVGNEMSKLISISEEMGKRAAAVSSRGASPVSMRNTLAAIAGGGATGSVAGGFPGAVAGGLIAAGLNSPTGRRMATQGAVKTGSFLSNSGAKAASKAMTPMHIGGRVGTLGAYRGLNNAGDPSEAAEAQSLEDALMQSQSMPNQSQSAFTATQANSPTASGQMNPFIKDNPFVQTGESNPFMDESYQNPQQQSSPYSKESLLADIQRDPQNAKEYIAYYQQLDEIFNPQVEAGGGLNRTTADRIASVTNADNTISQLEGLFGNAGGGSGRIGGYFSNQASKAGFNDNVQTYNDLAQSSVTQIAKALNGGGQVSDADAAVVIQALPRVTDSPRVAQAKFQALRQRLQNAQRNSLTFGGDSGSLEDALMQQGAY